MSRSGESVQMERTTKIVKILIKNEMLVRDWRQFYDSLGLRHPNIIQWTNGYDTGTLTTHHLFMNIIQNWESQKGEKATLVSLCETLESMGLLSAAEFLEKEFKISKPKTGLSLCFNVGSVSKNFVGRNKELDKLEKIYTSGSDKIVVISGLGGIGKTQLVKKFAQTVHNKGNANVTWFNGETEQSLLQSLTVLADKMGIKINDAWGKTKVAHQLFIEVAASLSNNEMSTTWLVVFDNVDEMNEELLSSLQLIQEKGNVLAILTSRNQTIAEEDMILISLEEWDTEVAVEFVKLSLNLNATPCENTLIRGLCDRLGNHALGMTQAMAYIIKQQRNSIKGKAYSISNYLDELDAGGRKTSKLLDHKLSLVSQKFAKTTYVTWDITIEKIKLTEGDDGRFASQILDRIAYLDPNGISLQFLNTISEDNVDEAVTLLKGYSLIKIEDEVITVHRLVQEVIRIKLNVSNEEKDLLISLMQVMQNLTTFSRHELIQSLSVWKYCSKEDILVRKLSQAIVYITGKLFEFLIYSDSEMNKFTRLNYRRLFAKF